MKTWHYEAAFDAALLGGVVAATTPASAIAWLGALAVWLSARHASVADRLREAEEERQKTLAYMTPAQPPSVTGASAMVVHCVAWLDRYWVSKEICWIIYFAMLGAWPALVGALRFLVWPWWRRIYRRWRPRNRDHGARLNG
jgi:Flp pilus assembly protein TadB